MQDTNRFEVIYKETCPKNKYKQMSIISVQFIKDHKDDKTYLHIQSQSNYKFLTITETSIEVQTQSRYRKYTVKEKVSPGQTCFEDEIIDVSELMIKNGEAISVTIKPNRIQKKIILPVIFLIAAILTFFIFSQIQNTIRHSMQEKASKKHPEIVNVTKPHLDIEENQEDDSKKEEKTDQDYQKNDIKENSYDNNENSESEITTKSQLEIE